MNCLTTWLFEWQTLVGGVLAVAAGLATAILILCQMRQVETHERARITRQTNSARVTLPLTLSSVARYATNTAAALAELTLAARAAADGDPELSFTPPPPPADAASALERVAGATDDRNVTRAIARLLGELQLLDTRMSFTRQQLTPPGDGFARELEHLLLLSASVYALAEALFEFARFEKQTVPEELTWDRVFASMQILHLYEELYPELHRHAAALRNAGQAPHHFRGQMTD